MRALAVILAVAALYWHYIQKLLLLADPFELASAAFAALAVGGLERYCARADMFQRAEVSSQQPLAERKGHRRRSSKENNLNRRELILAAGNRLDWTDLASKPQSRP